MNTSPLAFIYCLDICPVLSFILIIGLGIRTSNNGIRVYSKAVNVIYLDLPILA